MLKQVQHDQNKKPFVISEGLFKLVFVN